MLAMPEDSLDNRSFYPLEGWSDYEDSYLIYSDLGAEIECENLLSTVDAEMNTNTQLDSNGCMVPSLSPSVASSECSDLDAMVDDDVSLISSRNETDVIRVINEECLPDAKCLYSSSDSCQTNKEWRSFSGAYVEHFENVKWSRMTSDHQVEVLQEITQIVSQKLGLREQLELIRLICPEADVSPTDDEFFIDLDLFNDANFNEVCGYVRKQLKLLDGSSQRQVYGTAKLGRKKRRDSMEKPIKRDLKAQSMWPQRRKTPLKRKPIAKSSKQMRKEKRSGLFAKEQVISIPKKDEDCEGVEIDILD